MSLYIDFDRNKGFFRRNGKKMIELNLNPNKLAYYPMIGLHSSGEVAQILEPWLWTPRSFTDVSFELLMIEIILLHSCKVVFEWPFQCCLWKAIPTVTLNGHSDVNS